MRKQLAFYIKNLKKIILYWIVTLYFICLLGTSIAIFDSFSNNLGYSKEIWLYISTIIGLLLSLFVLTKNKTYFRFVLLDFLILTFLWIIPLSQFLIHYNNSFTIIIQFVCIGFCYISFRLLTSLFHPITLTKIFFNAILIVFFINVFIGIWQYLGLSLSYYPTLGPTGVFFNPGPYAIYLSAQSIWVIWFTTKYFHRNKLLSIINSVFLSAAFILIAISLSRSAWMGFFGGLSLSIFIFFTPKFNLLKVLSRGTIILLLCGVLYSILTQFKTDSANGRLLIWKVTSSIIHENWIKGVGIGKFSPNYLNYQKQYFEFNNNPIEQTLSDNVGFAFNDTLHFFAEGGILNGILFITILIIVVLSIVKKRSVITNNLQLIMISSVFGSITVIFIASFTAYPLQVLPISVFFWIQIAILVNITQKNNILKEYFISQTICVCVLFSLFLIFYIKNKREAYIYLTKNKINFSQEDYNWILSDNSDYLVKKSESYAQYGDIVSAIKYIKRAMLHDPYPNYYYKKGYYYELIKDNKSAFLAYDFIEKAIPNRLTPKYLKLNLYYKQKDSLLFIKYAKLFLETEPKVHTSETVEMKQDIRNKLFLYMDSSYETSASH